MITAFYAAISAFWIVWLSRQVIALRRRHQIKLGDDNRPDLQAAIRAQGNATEYIPLTLILMFTLEFVGGHWLLLHLAGIALITGRLLHAAALNQADIRRRILSMRITLNLLIILAVLNLVYLLINSINS